MDLDNIIYELRELEGVNASFDYGVELLVMGIKAESRNIFDIDDLKYIIACGYRHWGTLFEFDKVCRQGFEVASKKLLDMVEE